SLVGGVGLQLPDPENARHVHKGRYAVHEPAIVVALEDDLFFEGVGQTLHQGAHQILESHHTDHVGIFAHHDGKAGALRLELGENLPHVELVRHRQDIPTGFAEVHFALLVERRCQDVLGAYTADYGVDAAIA